MSRTAATTSHSGHCVSRLCPNKLGFVNVTDTSFSCDNIELNAIPGQTYQKWIENFPHMGQLINLSQIACYKQSVAITTRLCPAMATTLSNNRLLSSPRSPNYDRYPAYINQPPSTSRKVRSSDCMYRQDRSQI